MSEELLRADPLLRDKPFDKFSFVFLIAINEPEDMHPITMTQLAKLSLNERKTKIVMRVSKNADKIQEATGKIEFTREYFSKRVISEGAVKGFSRFWICGPPKLNTDTTKILVENGYQTHSYLLV